MKTGHRRLFLAVEPPPQVKRGGILRSLGIDGVDWVREEQVHLTLLFLGDVACNRVPEVVEALDPTSVAPFALTTTAPGFFPNLRRPSVFWLGVAPSAELSALHARLRTAVLACGVAAETRRYVPHITLARVKRRLKPEEMERLSAAAVSLGSQRFVVAAFHLFASDLKSTGAVHTLLR